MNQQAIRGRKHVSGLSLIELMISLVIGLIMMIAIVSTYLGASGASRMSDAQSRMNEDAQAALTILTQQLRMAGNNPKQENYTNAVPRNRVYSTNTFAIRGCDGTFSNIATAADISALNCVGGSAPHSIAVSYEADRYNTVPTIPPASSPTDCVGNSLPLITDPAMNVWNGLSVVPTAVTYAVADNRFYVGTTTVGGTVGGVVTPSLYCKGNGGASVTQPLVENVEDLKFQYGAATIAAPTTSLTVAGYLSADQIGALAMANDDLRWSRVVTVRICVLVRSEQIVVSDADSARYVPCFPATAAEKSGIAAPDRRLRRAYTTTVVLRNRTVPS